jgi:hypothetical protein
LIESSTICESGCIRQPVSERCTLVFDYVSPSICIPLLRMYDYGRPGIISVRSSVY